MADSRARASRSLGWTLKSYSLMLLPALTREAALPVTRGLAAATRTVCNTQTNCTKRAAFRGRRIRRRGEGGRGLEEFLTLRCAHFRGFFLLLGIASEFARFFSLEIQRDYENKWIERVKETRPRARPINK